MLRALVAALVVSAAFTILGSPVHAGPIRLGHWMGETSVLDHLFPVQPDESTGPTIRSFKEKVKPPKQDPAGAVGTPVPELGTLTLLALGCGAAGLAARRKKLGGAAQ